MMANQITSADGGEGVLFVFTACASAAEFVR
jgi:hypothetical protein